MTSSKSQPTGSSQPTSRSREKDKIYAQPLTTNNKTSSLAKTDTSKTKTSATKDDDQKSNTRKFDKILDSLVNSEKISLRETEDWLKHELCDLKLSDARAIKDLVIEHMKSEKYPDARVLQLEISDLYLLSDARCKKLMRKLWTEILDQQTERSRSNKYQKVSISKSSSSRVANDNYRDHHHSHGQSYSYGYSYVQSYRSSS